MESKKRKMGRKKGPARPNLAQEILDKLEEYPDGIWVRKLARELNEPVMTIHNYVLRKDNDYPGKFVEIVERLMPEEGGHVKLRLLN